MMNLDNSFIIIIQLVIKMGNSYSYMETEKKTWVIHNLNFDSSIRAANLNTLQNIKDELIFI